MKMQGYGITINGQFVVQQIHLHEDTALRIAHQINYERFFKDDVHLCKVDIEYKKIKQITQPQGELDLDTDTWEGTKLKKRKKLRRRLKG